LTVKGVNSARELLDEAGSLKNGKEGDEGIRIGVANGRGL